MLMTSYQSVSPSITAGARGSLELRLQPAQLGPVGGPPVAPALVEGLEDLVVVLQHHRLEVQVPGAEVVGQVQLRRGSGRHAHRSPVHVIDRGEVPLTDHHGLAVVVVHVGEVDPLGPVPAGGPGGVAHQHVVLARPQGAEPGVRIDRDKLEVLALLWIRRGEDGRGEGLAEVDVEPLDHALGRLEPEPGNGVVDPAPQGAPLLDRLEQALLRLGLPLAPRRRRLLLIAGACRPYQGKHHEEQDGPAQKLLHRPSFDRGPAWTRGPDSLHRGEHSPFAWRGTNGSANGGSAGSR
jgi:hypothetical protein